MRRKTLARAAMLAHRREAGVESGRSPELSSPIGRRTLVRSIAQLLGLVAVVVAVVLAVPGPASIRGRLESGAPGWLVLAGAARLASAIAYAVVFRAISARNCRGD